MYLKKKIAIPKANIFVTGIDSMALKCGLALGLASFETHQKKNSEHTGSHFTLNNIIYSEGIMKQN